MCEHFTKFPNWLLESLTRLKLNGVAWQILMVIIRKTYGFHKDEDWIALSQFSKFTGKRRTNASRELQKLVKRKIILKRCRNIERLYSINRDTGSWVGLLDTDKDNDEE